MSFQQSYKGDQVDQLVHQMQSNLRPSTKPMYASEVRNFVYPCILYALGLYIAQNVYVLICVYLRI